MWIIQAIFLFVFFSCSVVRANDSFDDVHVLERDPVRIKATGDLRGGEKLMKVVVRFRDDDVMILGNDYRYAHLTVIPYDMIQTMTYSDIGDPLPRSLHRAAPLYQESFDGRDQRWFAIRYTEDENDRDVLLMLDREIDGAFLSVAASRSKKEIVQSVDGIPRVADDIVFRKCRVFRTTVTDKGKSNTDDYACAVIMRGALFEIVGQDKDYQDRFEVSYDSVRGLFYEHSKQTSYMGRMPGIGAFRKAKHWFVIEGEGTTALMLAPEIVADFRDAAQAKTNVSINAYGGKSRVASLSQASALPEILGVSPDEAPIDILMSAKTIRCLLGPGTRVKWPDGKLVRDGEARYDDQAPELTFDAIDLKKQTATLLMGETKKAVRIVASEMALTFLAVDDVAFVTTVFARNDGQLVCVHSQHATGILPQAGQFYGVAEVVEKR